MGKRERDRFDQDRLDQGRFRIEVHCGEDRIGHV